MSLNRNIDPHGQRILKVQKRAHILYIHTNFVVNLFFILIFAKRWKKFQHQIETHTFRADTIECH